MDLRCPLCQAPLSLAEIPSDVLHSISRVECPNCGLIPLNSAHSTVSYQQPSHETKIIGHRTIAHFEILRILGRGSFGEVWLAHDTALEREVALKTLHAEKQETDALVHEAQSVAKLNHPNIVAVYEVGHDQGCFYLASEFIDGFNLRDMLSAGKPSQDRGVALTLAIAEALEHAHEHGVIHRDIKPANIMIDRQGKPHVTDFGLAKRTTSEKSISAEGQILGTALYMSPEQARGDASRSDGRSDQYSVGVILFEMLTGHVPFRGNLQAILHNKVDQDAPSPRTLNPNVPKDLETICLKCLERDPEKRYRTTGDLVKELTRFQNREPISARPVSSAEKAWRWCLRHRAVSSLTAGLLLSLVLGILAASFFAARSAKSARLANERLHRSEMNVAAQYLHKGDINGVRRTLERFESDEQLAALRGFAWNYYRQAIAPFLQVSNQGDPVVDVAVFPSGTLYAACGRNREIRVWETATGKLLRTLGLDAGQFRSISVSSSDSHLASGSSDGYVRIWDPLEHDRPTREFKHGPPVQIVRYSHSGKRLLSAGVRGAVRVWDAKTGELLNEIPTGMAGTKAVRFSPDGKAIAIATKDGRIRVRDVKSGAVQTVLESNALIESLAYSDDGKIIATGNYAGRVEIWSVKSGEVLFAHETSLGIIGDLEFFKNSPLLAMPAVSGELIIFRHETRARNPPNRHAYLTEGIVDRSANGRVLVVGSGGGSVKLLDVDRLSQPNLFWHRKTNPTGETIATSISTQNPVRAVSLHKDRRHLIAASVDGRVLEWDLKTGTSKTIEEPTSEDRLLLMAMDKDHNQLLLVHREKGSSVRVRNGEKFGEPIPISFTDVTSAAFSPDGTLLALGTETSLLLVFRTTDWTTTVLNSSFGKSAIAALQFSPDGKRLAVGGYQSIGIFDCDNWDDRRWFDGHTARCLTFCQNGASLAIGTESGEIEIRDVDTGRTQRVIQAHASRVNVVTAFPGGEILASGGRDKQVNLWHAESGELITTLLGHRRQIVSIDISSDGKTIASGGLIGEIHLWESGPR